MSLSSRIGNHIQLTTRSRIKRLNRGLGNLWIVTYDLSFCLANLTP